MTIESVMMVEPIMRLRIKIKDWSSKKDRLLEILDKTEIKVYPKDCHDSPATSFHTQNKETTQEVATILSEELDLFHETVGPSSEMTMTAWFQTYGVGQYHQLHIHQNVSWASLIYLDYDKRFHRPTYFFFTNHFSGEPDQWYSPDDEEGYWYFWPAGIPHQTIPCDIPGAPVRRIMSANIVVKQ